MNVKPVSTTAIRMLPAWTPRAHGYAIAQAGLQEMALFAQVGYRDYFG